MTISTKIPTDDPRPVRVSVTGHTMSFFQQIERAKSIVENEMLNLETTANHLVDQHWKQIDEWSKSAKRWDHRPRLYCRIKKGTNGRVFSIEWYRITKWFKDRKGVVRKKKEYVPIGRGKSQHTARLPGYGHPYERDEVWALEAEFGEIRRALKLLTQARAALRQVIKGRPGER